MKKLFALYKFDGVKKLVTAMKSSSFYVSRKTV